MPKTIINKAIYEKAKKGLIQLQSKGTAANKLKAIKNSCFCCHKSTLIV